MFGFFVPFLVLGALWWFLWRFVFSRRARLLRRFGQQGVVLLSAAREGQIARFVGRVSYLDPPLEAPLSGRSCVCYEGILEQMQSSGNSSHWSKVGSEVKSVRAFYLDGVHERAIVQLENPTVLIVDDHHTRSGMLDDPTAREQKFAQRIGVSTQGFVFNKSMRYREGVIEEGELVAVVGKCMFERDPTPGARGGYRGQALRKRIVRPDDQDMLLSDEPQAARVN